jgi:hypothetical protein
VERKLLFAQFVLKGNGISFLFPSCEQLPVAPDLQISTTQGQIVVLGGYFKNEFLATFLF